MKGEAPKTLDGRFRNLDPKHQPQTAAAVLRWAVWDRLTGRRNIAPPGPPAPRQPADLDLVHRLEGPDRLTWIGHASFLLTLGADSVLIDPVFSERIGWVYPRHGKPGLLPHDLPTLRAILLTHNHYDHLDEPSLKALPRSVPVFVPVGLGSVLRRWGFERVTELQWWEDESLGALRLTLVPARHWSRRTPWDTNRSLWGGFVVEGRGRAIYHAGDTAAFETFQEIGRRFPDLTAALLPIGAYEPGWFMENNHMTPEQAGEAFRQLGARLLVPMHWGAFQLTDEPLCEPAERLRQWWLDATMSGRTTRRLAQLAVGETLVLEGY
jgi:L-ascorbate metabolism protein UlaG (beta-lactamase superfamily)